MGTKISGEKLKKLNFKFSRNLNWKKWRRTFVSKCISNVFTKDGKNWSRIFWDLTFKKCDLKTRFFNETSKIMKIWTILQSKIVVECIFYIYMWSYRSTGYQIKIIILSYTVSLRNTHKCREYIDKILDSRRK